MQYSWPLTAALFPHPLQSGSNFFPGNLCENKASMLSELFSSFPHLAWAYLQRAHILLAP